MTISATYKNQIKKLKNMPDKERMPRVDLGKDLPQMDQAQLYYIKKIEKKNIERVRDLQKIRRRNILTGCLLAGGVMGIYMYSMFAVKQETFLDDFDEPTKEPAK